MTYDPSGFPQLIFQEGIGKQKPSTLHIQDTASACPFCDPSQLPPTVKQDGDILLVPNKYPILRDSNPFVLIETSECDSELSFYPEDRLLRVFRMGFDVWRDMMSQSVYRSVLFIKNHGPMSGGSLRHPHMQLIGLYHVDCQAHIRHEDFYGPVIHQGPGVELNVSDHPRVGFTELNAILTDEKAFADFCALIQKAAQYVLRYFHGGRIDSYNLFFYMLDGITYCKIMPRAATTPIFIGYSIPQVADDLDAVAEDFRNRFPMP